MNDQTGKVVTGVTRVVLLVLASFWLGTRWDTLSASYDLGHFEQMVVRAFIVTPMDTELLEVVKLLADCASVANFVLNGINWMRARWKRDHK